MVPRIKFKNILKKEKQKRWVERGKKSTRMSRVNRRNYTDLHSNSLAKKNLPKKLHPLVRGVEAQNNPGFNL